MAGPEVLRSTNYRAHPELYRIGRGEQGVLTFEPYKSEILKNWRFKTPNEARESARAIVAQFRAYKRERDFVGMDMARKFLQMGYTRATRYARHRGGRKYDAHGNEKPLAIDTLKAESAAIFLDEWKRVEADRTYAKMKREWKELYG